MEDSGTQVVNPGKSATVVCIQYLISYYLNNKKIIRKDDLLKTDALKGRISGKNYDRAMEDVSTNLRNVFGLTLSHLNNKQFIIVNEVEELYFPGIEHDNWESVKYRNLLKPIIGALVMLRVPISEAQMWIILKKFTDEFGLNIEVAKKIVKEDFVEDMYLTYKVTDETTVMYDPEKTSYWFSLGPRALIECDQAMILQRVSELFNKPPSAFKRVYSKLHKQ